MEAQVVLVEEFKVAWVGCFCLDNGGVCVGSSVLRIVCFPGVNSEGTDLPYLCNGDSYGFLNNNNINLDLRETNALWHTTTTNIPTIHGKVFFLKNYIKRRKVIFLVCIWFSVKNKLKGGFECSWIWHLMKVYYS